MFAKLGTIAQQIATGMTSGTLFLALLTIGFGIFGYMLVFNHVNHSIGLRVAIGAAIVGGAAGIATAFS
jgi:hypothetical protein